MVVRAAHDLWALGATLTELLSGNPLLPANDEAHWATLHAALGGDGEGSRVPRAAARDERALLASLLSDDPSARADVASLRDSYAWAKTAASPTESSTALPAAQKGDAGTDAASGEPRLALEEVDAASSAEAVLKLLRDEAAAANDRAGVSS